GFLRIGPARGRLWQPGSRSSGQPGAVARSGDGGLVPQALRPDAAASPLSGAAWPQVVALEPTARRGPAASPRQRPRQSLERAPPSRTWWPLDGSTLRAPRPRA